MASRHISEYDRKKFTMFTSRLSQKSFIVFRMRKRGFRATIGVLLRAIKTSVMPTRTAAPAATPRADAQTSSLSILAQGAAGLKLLGDSLR